MIPFSLGSVVAGLASAQQHLHSAHPGAPVVADPARTPARPIARTRSLTAAVLLRAAHRIAPA